MTKPSLRQRCVRAVMAIAVGGSAFQLSGCEPDVRTAILGTLEGTTQGFITAFFLSLQEDGISNGLTTTS